MWIIDAVDWFTERLITHYGGRSLPWMIVLASWPLAFAGFMLVGSGLDFETDTGQWYLVGAFLFLLAWPYALVMLLSRAESEGERKAEERARERNR